MEAINGISGFVKPQERLIKKFVCDGCGRDVEQKEMVIPLGPYKGKTVTVNDGCKCEDLKLAKEAIKKSYELKYKKMKDRFDYYSLLNNSLESATLENYCPTNETLAKAKKQAEDYVNNFDGKKNLLLHGGYGTGKSHLSVAVTKKLMEQGKECLFLSLPKLLTKIKGTFNNKGVSEEELLEYIEHVDLLVLDDLGAEHATEWTTSKVFEILDDRSGKSTIYTTNLGSKELRERFNDRNFSRLMENTEIIKVDGQDYRRKEF